ncbi:MAG: dihydroorotase [Gammaproteobacteria bacterium]|nr:dihydroorotase [Gammaproteobacteria bacterium]
MSIRLKGGLALDPAAGTQTRADVFIEHGKIVAVGRAPSGFKARREIDVSGCVVAPGLVDLGSRLREPGYEHKASIASEAHAAAGAGFTTLCATPDTQPILDTPAVAEQIHHLASLARGARIRCLGALTVGLAGEVLTEMHALKAAGCVAVTNLERTIKDTAVLKHALAYAASSGLAVFLHPEEYWLARQGSMHEGATSTRLGVPGIPRAAEIIGLHRDLTLVAETGVRAHLCRLSTAEAIKSVVDAKRAGLAVTADVDLMHLLHTDADAGQFDANFHLRPPLRERSDRTALRQGVKRGSVDAITANHEPHDADAKAAPFALTEPGVSTLDTFLPKLLSLVAAGAFDLQTAWRAASLAPHRLLGSQGGTLSVGAPADLCVFDPEQEWTAGPEALLSKGLNSPYLGECLKGRNILTLVDGQVVFTAKDRKA